MSTGIRCTVLITKVRIRTSYWLILIDIVAPESTGEGIRSCMYNQRNPAHHHNTINIFTHNSSVILPINSRYTLMTIATPSPRASRTQHPKHVLPVRPMIAWTPLSAHQALAKSSRSLSARASMTKISLML
jgi:hypothetical protein